MSFVRSRERTAGMQVCVLAVTCLLSSVTNAVTGNVARMLLRRPRYGQAFPGFVHLYQALHYSVA